MRGCPQGPFNRHHPIRDYLVSLKWDGIKRIDDWLTLYMGADPSVLVRAFGAKFLISGVPGGAEAGLTRIALGLAPRRALSPCRIGARRPGAFSLVRSRTRSKVTVRLCRRVVILPSYPPSTL